MTPDIINKLSDEINKGITTEVQVVYLLAGIRKVIERDVEQKETKEEKELEKGKYPNLYSFYCNWILHSNLTNTFAAKILDIFEKASHAQNSNSYKLPEEIPEDLQHTINMYTFKKDLDNFIKNYEMPNFDYNAWVNFIKLYFKVVKDIPLVIKPRHEIYIKKVSLTEIEFEEVTTPKMQFRVIWTVEDNLGSTESYPVYFSL